MFVVLYETRHVHGDGNHVCRWGERNGANWGHGSPLTLLSRKPVPGVLQLVRSDFESEGKTYITRAIWLWERYSYSFPNSHNTVISLPAVAFMTQPNSSKPLMRRTTSQEDSISSLLHDYLSPIRDYDLAPCSWEALKNLYWGKGLDSLEEEELVERGENQGPHTPRSVPSYPFRFVSSPHVQSCLGLIKPESLRTLRVLRR